MADVRHAHFIGVGGAGMSGIALVLSGRGAVVTGSDIRASRYTAALEQAGITVSIGHDASHVGECDVVVVSSAIPESNPELAEARRRGIEVWPRARMLAYLAGERRVIAVAGTHGKTTTSSMVATMISGLGLDPTFLIGGEVTEYGTNAVSGAGEYYIVEADESDGSFIFLEPDIAVVTNIEADHLDHYGSLEHIEETFVEFMRRVRPDGTLVVCADDARLTALARSCGTTNVLTYGVGPDADVKVESVEPQGLGHRFQIRLPAGSVVEASTMFPGIHNVANAAAALAVAFSLGLDVGAAASALSEFGGVRRRFDQVGVAAGVTVVDDYAHHPTEVRATLAAASRLGFGRVCVVFQPHRYSRTAALADDFGTAFQDADQVVLFDVYGAGETPIPGITGHTLVDAIMRERPRTRLAWLPHRADAAPFLVGRLREGDLVLTMGAGDVTTFGPELVRALDIDAHEG